VAGSAEGRPVTDVADVTADDLRAQVIDLCATLVEFRASVRQLAWRVRTESLGELELARALEHLADEVRV